MSKLCCQCETFKEGQSSRAEDATVAESRRIFHNWDDGDDGTKDYLLHYSAAEDHLDCVSFTLGLGENVNQLSKVAKRTALIVAARKGLPKMAELLIERGADVNICDSQQKNALWYSASIGNLDCVKLLLNAGSKFTKQTPLAAATWGGHVECMRLLLENGDKFGLFESPEGSTYLERNSWFLFAVSMCHFQTSVIKLLLDLMIKEEGALSWDIFLGVVNKNNKQLLQDILDTNVPIKKGRGLNADYNEALHLAAESSNDETVQVLLDNRVKLGIKIDMPFGLDPRTALQKACDQDVVRVTEVLLEYGADPEKINPEGSLMGLAKPPVFIVLRTLSYTGCGLHNLAALIKHGCNLERKVKVNLRGVAEDVAVTPLEYALYGGNLYAAKMLVLGGAQNYNPAFPMAKPHKKVIHKDLECTKKEKDTFIAEELQCPRSLYILCRAAVRKCIHGDARSKITQLPLAKHVQEFVAYQDIDEIAAGYAAKMENLEISSTDDQEASVESFSGDDSLDFDDSSSDDDDFDDSWDMIDPEDEEDGDNYFQMGGLFDINPFPFNEYQDY